ncbi:MAG TPA: ABC transporter permease [Candidatus Sulfomarinibacteraceae bacterium]|nr:ABC transporter permease [Candidatus Sulfomarinibacteraceae bacterium]
MIAALVWKDIKLFFRNQFFAVVTVLGLVAYVALYFVLPAEANDRLNVAVYVENPQATTVDETFAEFFDYTLFPSEDEMRAALQGDEQEYIVGLSVSQAAAEAITSGEAAEVSAVYAPGIPAETKQVYDDLLVIMANSPNPAAASSFARVNETSVVLGNDIYDTPIPIRERIIPMLLLFILAVEAMGLATLIIQEIQTGTARALITSPLRLPHFFTSKALMGMLLAFSQLFLLVLITGKFGASPLLLTLTLLLGSFLIVGVGFFIAAISSDTVSVLAWGMLIIILFAIPAISIMLPGLATAWIELIPSYFLVDALHRILNFDAGWADVGRNLAILFAIGAGTLLLGAGVLRRRF